MGCHQTPGPQGPDLDKYLAGGVLFKMHDGTYVTRNLTPDKETGLARHTDDEVKRVLRSGVLPDGRVVSYRMMPWGSYTNWTEEDRHAVVVYLRHLKPVRHQVPEPAPASTVAAGRTSSATREPASRPQTCIGSTRTPTRPQPEFS